MARRAKVPGRAQLLHAAARPRGHATRHLRGVAASRRARRVAGGPLVRGTGRFGGARAGDAVHGRGPPAGNGRAVSGDQGCGSHHRAGGFAEGVEESAAFRRALGNRRPGLRGHLLSVGPVPRHYPGGRPGRIFPVGRPERNGKTGTGRGGGSMSGTVRTVVIWMVVWWTPVVLLMVLGGYDILVQVGNFFSRLAVVTFGGAYAVLAYLAQDVVTHKGWLSAGEMMDGLGLAETTPGPLILVTEFVGYIAGYRAGGVGMGIAGALVTLWVTFAPCFLWIFAGAPYIEQLPSQPRLKGALESITAAVVGVILNLSIWFGLHVLFAELPSRQFGPVKLLAPDWYSLDWRVLLVGAVSAIMLLWRHQSLMRTLGVAALMGLGFAAMGNFAG